MKKLLFITHQLSLSGAPLVLMEMIRVCRDEGYEISVISLMEGELSATLDDMGIPWRVQADFLQNWKEFYLEVHGYHAVIVNTLVAYQPLIVLNHTQVPTFWWIHESEDFFEIYDKMGEAVPDLHALKPRVKILSVSPSVQEIFRRRYGLETEILPFCVQDNDNVTAISSPEETRADDRVKFLTLGMYCANKGQDILAEAIRMLPESVLSQCEFHMYGGAVVLEPDFRSQVREALKDIPHAHVHDAIPHEEAMNVMEESDYCIIASRIEPVSAVTVEAMIRRKPCILTDVCGIAWYLKDGESAYFCPSEDAKALSDRICKAVEDYRTHAEDYRAMGNAARAVYEQTFSPGVFRKSVLHLLGDNNALVSQ
ncbi:MAG: glycosyltransferase family 4 protein [Lachnospiraceae bacterium]|nr:glycosyltransferase family 4 protein [Lachnospiraceae bacterium]